MQKTHVLIADDHALVRAGIRNAIENEQNLQIVGEVGDGPSVIAALAELQPDLLIIDVTMPQFEPIAAIEQIRHTYPRMLILVVSAYDDDVYVQGLLRLGVNGYHLKDQPLSDLRLAVERVLAGQRWISSSLVEKLVQPSAAPTAVSHKLSRRQVQILQLLAQGMDNRTMANQLGLSIKTIETHLTRLYRQLNVQSRLEAVNFAHQHPEITEQSTAVPTAATPVERGHKANILIVDDNHRYRQQLRRLVGRIYPQASIYEAANIAEAIRTVQQTTPKLVLIDVVLGNENGIQCARWVKAESHQAKVVLMSAYPDREFHRQGLEAGASAFLDKKDIDAATLYQIIIDAVE
ncbi:MAG: response regulator [Candidatus Promineifilaceae bacterium]